MQATQRGTRLCQGQEEIEKSMILVLFSWETQGEAHEVGLSWFIEEFQQTLEKAYLQLSAFLDCLGQELRIYKIKRKKAGHSKI